MHTSRRSVSETKADTVSFLQYPKFMNTWMLVTPSTHKVRQLVQLHPFTSTTARTAKPQLYARDRMLLQTTISIICLDATYRIAMETRILNSSAIHSVDYDQSQGQMIISFHDSGSYTFCGVPRPIFIGLTTAASAGQCYNDHVRSRFQC